MSGIRLHGNFRKLKKSAVVSLIMASAVFSAYAEEIVYSEWNPKGSGNWSDATRWIDGIVPPAVDGNVRIVRSEAYATDDDYDILNKLFRLRFRWKSSLDLRFDRDHYDFAPNSIEEITDNVQNDSTLIKSGKGRLVWIDGFERILMDRLVVTNGVLELRDANRAVVFGARGDGLLAFNGNEDESRLYISGLEGDGVVTNMRPSVRVVFTGGTAEKPNVFSGTVTKSFEPEFDYGCYQDFTGMSSESCTVRIYDGSVGLRVIGMTGEPGSL